MAIKTKKISELADIKISSEITEAGISTLDASKFYLLGCRDDMTGKVSTKNIIDVVRLIVNKIADEKIEEFSKNTTKSRVVENNNTSNVDSSIESLKVAQANLGQKNDAVTNTVNVLNTTVNGLTNRVTNHISSTSKGISDIQESIADLSENCNEKIAALEAKSATLEAKVTSLESKAATLEAKVAALEGFVQALQAEGYLTLANIKKAAADACPICTHTHEEEQPSE